MRELGKYMLGVLGAIAATAGAAHAERTLVVVIDASGSMQIDRGGGQTRFAAAVTEAANRVDILAGQVEGLASVSVYTFSGAGATNQTGGFVNPTTARNMILGLSVTSDLTPLAGSLCDTIDVASASGSHSPGSARLMEVYSDGAENNTPAAHACFGLPSNDPEPPFEGNSWQNRVYLRATNLPPVNSVTITPHLFTNVSFSAAPSLNPEAALLAKAGRPTAAAASALPDADFFAILAADTGGVFETIVDGAPLAVFADLDSDFDVDRADAIQIARQFGRPATAAFDLNADKKIGFADYSILRNRFGTGTGTPDPDPFKARQPVVCSAFQKVVITGQAIESSGVTIDARLGCTVEIKNSLVVSGQNAIQISGGATIKVDNSTLVGENAVLVLTGGAVLSAANTVFHGNKKLVGLLTYIDRGGNVWE